jgi:hypothetical protein
LTKADLALKDGRDVLKKIILKIFTYNKSLECFVVHGTAKDFEEEEIQLAMVAGYIEELHLADRVKVRVKELNNFMEERMLDHIKEKIPGMRRLLEEELRLRASSLDVLGRVAISSIASQSMKEHLAETYASFQPDNRRLTERMARDIFALNMKPLGIVDAAVARRKLVSEYQCTSRSLRLFQSQHHLLALEAKKIGEDSRTLINVPYVGKRSELEKWLYTFANPFETILRKFIDDIFSAFSNNIFQPSLMKGSSESTKVAMRDISIKMRRNVIRKARSAAREYTACLAHSSNTNAFNTNDHYLTETSGQLEDKFKKLSLRIEDAYMTHMKPYFEIIYGIMTFFKTRKKMLPDTIQMYFTTALDDLFKETEKEIGIQMLNEKTLNMIKESARSVSKRKFHLERETKIKTALEEISLI